MDEDLTEQLEEFLTRVEKRLPTLEQKKAITKAGAKVYQEVLKNNTPKSKHNVKKHTVGSIKLSTEKSGNSSVYFSNKKGEKGYIARLLNDGYMSHGGKGSSSHTIKFIQGKHFVEKSYLESQDKVFEAMKDKYIEEVENDS